MADKQLKIAVFLSLCPLLGLCCSCFKVSDRSESLKDGVCYGDVYSAVVVEVTCNCLFGTRYDCRKYSTVSSESYSAEISTRLNCSGRWPIPQYAEQTCMEVETAIAPGDVCLCVSKMFATLLPCSCVCYASVLVLCQEYFCSII